MLRRLEPDERGLEQAALYTIAPEGSEPVGQPRLEDAEAELLPRGHPKWVRDGVAISQRARDLVTRLRPVVVRVVRFWDHRFHATVIAGRHLRVDPSGSYQVE